MRVLLPERKRASDSANSKIYWLFVHGFSLVIFNAFPAVKIASGDACLPDTLPPVLINAGQESRVFIIRDCKRGGRVSGRCVRTIWRHPCDGSRVLKFGVGFNN